MGMPPDLDAPQVDLRRSDVLIFEGRLPDPAELLKWGGRPGIQYLIVNAANLDATTQETSDRGRWNLCKDVPVYQVSGPKGTASILILSRGIPIPGADPANGIREWFYDRSILTATGLTSPYGGPTNGQESRASNPQGPSQGGEQGAGNRNPQVPGHHQAEGPAPGRQGG